MVWRKLNGVGQLNFALISCLLPDVTVSWPQILHFPIFGTTLLDIQSSNHFFVTIFFFIVRFLFKPIYMTQLHELLALFLFPFLLVHQDSFFELYQPFRFTDANGFRYPGIFTQCILLKHSRACGQDPPTAGVNRADVWFLEVDP